MISTTNLLVPTWLQMLRALASWLDKAASGRPAHEADALLSARLASDMYPLATQIRFACVQPREAVARLRGEPFPPIIQTLLDEGRNAGERPGTMAEARTRITETIEMLAALAPDALDGDPARAIEHPLHLVGAGHEFAVMAAITEQGLRLCLLKIP